MNLPILDTRLASALDFVRPNSVVADIGTDHAYLPIYLVLSGKAAFAVASDINEGPVLRARSNVKSYLLEDKISVIRTDGLDKIEDFFPNDIIIFGMGGELISKILDKAPWIKEPDIQLILQPMTKQEELRSYLLKNGFCIKDERLSLADNKIYQTICASYCGVSEDWNEIELMLGKHNIKRREKLLSELVDTKILNFQTRLDAKRSFGHNINYEKNIIEELKKVKVGFYI